MCAKWNSAAPVRVSFSWSSIPASSPVPLHKTSSVSYRAVNRVLRLQLAAPMPCRGSSKRLPDSRYASRSTTSAALNGNQHSLRRNQEHMLQDDLVELQLIPTRAVPRPHPPHPTRGRFAIRTPYSGNHRQLGRLRTVWRPVPRSHQDVLRCAVDVNVDRSSIGQAETPSKLES